MALSQWLHLPLFQTPLKPFSFVLFSFSLNICSTLFKWNCIHSDYTFCVQTFQYPPYPVGNIYRKGIFRSLYKYLKSEFKFKAQIFGPELLLSLSIEGTGKSCWWFFQQVINKPFCSYHPFPFVGQCWFCLFLSTFLTTPMTALLSCFCFLQMIWFMSHTNTLSSTNFFSQDPCIWAIQLVPNNHNLILCLSFLLFPAADTPLTWTYIFILREQIIER